MAAAYHHGRCVHRLDAQRVCGEAFVALAAFQLPFTGKADGWRQSNDVSSDSADADSKVAVIIRVPFLAPRSVAAFLHRLQVRLSTSRLHRPCPIRHKV